MVPVRDVTAVLADTANCVTPLPATLLPPVIAIQAALLLAVQAQPAGALTAIDEFRATAPRDGDVGGSRCVHDAPPGSPVTGVWARPLPATLLPPVIAIQAALLLAVQAQPAGALTAIDEF